jgi:hypothetical protein
VLGLGRRPVKSGWDGQGRADLAGGGRRAAGSGGRGRLASAASSFPPPRGVGGQIRSEDGARRPTLDTQVVGPDGDGRRRQVVGAAWKAGWPWQLPLAHSSPPHSRWRW